MSSGMIFDIKEFGVHDGPGIRTTVFLKGCPLNCIWCHNPEGISFEKEIMKKDNKEEVVGEIKDSKLLAKELLEHKDFLNKTNGGITFSGGEPLAQPDFLFDVIKKLKGINIAIDTTGYCSKDVFIKANQLADIILFDIKHLDSKIHKKITGKDNTLILNNLEILCNNETPFYIRIPLIPGINDDKKHMEEIAFLLEGATNIIRVDLLTYHKTTGAKYDFLGKEYNPPFDEDQEPRVYKDVFLKRNLKVSVFK